MYIERIIVRKTKPITEIIRNIKFNESGLNLIVDKTSNILKESGNSVGKSTTVKIVDICLGAKSPSILYKDSETGINNQIVKDLIDFNKVEAELILKSENETTSIIRSLYKNGKYYINGKDIPQSEFDKKLKSLLFGSELPKPTFRQLMPRFIRLENQQLENVLHYLVQTSKEEFELIHLFLLNLSDRASLDKKTKILREFQTLKNEYKVFLKAEDGKSKDFLIQRIELLDRELENLISQRKNIDYIQLYKEQINQKSDLSNEINSLTINIDELSFEINLANQSISKLKTEKSGIKVNEIESIYKEAKAYIGQLGKNLEELIQFHNSMIENRIKFIQKNLNSKTTERLKLEELRESKLVERQAISIQLIDEGLLNDLNVLNLKIENLHENKGRNQELLDIINNYETNLNKLKTDLDNISNKISESKKQLNNLLIIFNTYFSEISEKLYGEKYLLTHNENWKEKKTAPFSIQNMQGNPGDGKKRAQVVAFDLAYLSYLEKENIPYPKFIIHDKLESTHINQIRTIFNLCTKIKGQYIVPILKERLNLLNQEILDKATILELSENDKFFKV